MPGSGQEWVMEVDPQGHFRALVVGIMGLCCTISMLTSTLLTFGSPL